MARNVATTRSVASARPAATTRSAVTSYRVPSALYDLGITRLYDWRTGFDGSKRETVENMMGSGNLSFRGGTALSSIYTTGQYQVDLERTASNDYFTTNPMILTPAMTSITIFAWIKQESAVASQIRSIITHWETTSNQRGFQFRVNGSNQMEIFFSSDGTIANQAAYTTTETLTDTASWHFLAGTYDTTNRGKIYLDTVAQTASLSTGADPATINSSQIALLIGANLPSAPSNFFDGLVGICGIAENRALSSAQITTLYNITNSIGRYV